MKFQLVILSTLLVCAFALPVPDEEVSPVKPDQKEVTEVVLTPEEKPIDIVKPELREAGELPLAKPEEKKELPAQLPANAPDAEIAQPLSIEKKEEKKSEKQVRVDDQVDEVKALPVVVAPAAAVEEEKKQIIDEVKPTVRQAVVEGKSADLAAEAAPAEQKKDVLSAAEETPIVKSDIPLPKDEITPSTQTESGSAPALKKEDAPVRQEREDEEGKNVAVNNIQEVKALKTQNKPEEAAEVAKPAGEQLKIAEPAKPVEEKKTESAAAGDIPVQSSEVSNSKALSPAQAEPAEQSPVNAAVPEGKKIEEPAPVVALGDAPAEQLPEPQAKKEEIKQTEPEKPAVATPENKKSEESESKESKESKESEESKESGDSKSN